ncbi:MAG: DUF4249 domain-containing protein [Bacteroidetes bacterium]|nr:DUF4249 domain-containing protein [Bacteroidota bacterium]
MKSKYYSFVNIIKVRFLKLLFPVFLGSMLFSCETIIDEIDPSKFPGLEQKLVMASFICPQDTVLRVFLSKSLPIYSEIPKYEPVKVPNAFGDTNLYYKKVIYVKNALVEISDGVNKGTFTMNPVNFEYELRGYKIVSGKTYTLRASVENFKVEANATVPNEVPEIENLKISRYTNYNQGFNKDTVNGFNLTFDWKDFPNQENYYKVFAEYSNYQKTPKEFSNGINNKKEFKNFSTFFWSNNDLNDNLDLINDNLLDGKTIFSPKGQAHEGKSNYCNNGGCFKTEIIKNMPQLFDIQLWHISKDMYQYMKSVRQSSNISDNPFSEPVPVFTNVKNGLGCFAAYNKRVLVMENKF